MKVNDRVRFLNDVGGGRIVRIEGYTVYVEDADGFERPVQKSDVVVVEESKGWERPLDIKTSLVEPDKPAPRAEEKPPVVVETPTGEELNVILAYEPREIKHLNTTTFYVTLVNDSNYYLYVTYATRGNEDSGWTTRFHGLIEPNMQETMEEVGYEDLPHMDRVAVQYVAFKQGKEYRLKNPALVDRKLDTTKFYKLHCFQTNEYFDNPVLSLEIVRRDLPAKPMVIDSGALERAMREKNRNDRPKNRPGQSPVTKKNDKLVVDLHIYELIDNTAGLDAAAMLAVQMDKFREVMKANANKLGQKVVFIHGKGEGVLRKSILDELRRCYPQCEVQDASFREYGFGATQVTIHGIANNHNRNR
ncbi:MAG: DUF2027 domain-containing protein [Muribaculaceae bacterium]|nr:DUF2027 domain-containing protein [Muribaculaceae bacterium]